jgi:hypothetical protein
MRYFNFTAIELVHVGTAPASITSIAKSRVEYTDDMGKHLDVDLDECARIYGCLTQIGAFPPDESTFKDYDHIQSALLQPLARSGWLTWDAT